MRMNRALHSPWVVGAVIVVMTAAVYGPILGHSFINFDDEQYVMAEPMVQAAVTLVGLYSRCIRCMWSQWRGFLNGRMC